MRGNLLNGGGLQHRGVSPEGTGVWDLGRSVGRRYPVSGGRVSNVQRNTSQTEPGNLALGAISTTQGS